MYVLLSAESGFAPSLYDLCRNVVHEFVVLSRYCLEGGQAALETMVQERLVCTAASVVRQLLVGLIVIVADYYSLMYFNELLV